MQNRFSMLDSARYTRADIESWITEATPDMPTDSSGKRAFDSVVTDIAFAAKDRDESNFRKIVLAAREIRIDWIDPLAKVDMVKTGIKIHPGYFITVTYKLRGEKYKLLMQADSLDRGFVLGNKLQFFKD